MLVEDQSSGTQLLQDLRSNLPTGVPMPIARMPDGDKLSRLAGVSAMIEAGQLLLPQEAHWLGELKQELLAFPSSRHKDQVDALSQLLAWVRNKRDMTTPNAGPEIIAIDDYWGTGDAAHLDDPDFDPWL